MSSSATTQDPRALGSAEVTVEGSGTTVVVGGGARGDGNGGAGTCAGEESGRGGKAGPVGGARSDDGGISPAMAVVGRSAP